MKELHVSGSAPATEISMTPEERILVERYLDGHLSGLELQQFMDMLEKDSRFREAISFQNLLQEGIRSASSVKLKNEILGYIQYRKPRVPLSLKLIITFLCITASGIIVWNYTGTDSAGISKKLFSFSFFRRPNDISKETEKIPSRSRKKEVVDLTTLSTISGQDVSSNAEEIKIANEPGTNRTESQIIHLDTEESRITNNGNFTIRKDQMLVSHIFPVNLVAEVKKTIKEEVDPTGTLGKSTIEKLNPESGLAGEDEKFPDSYLVEFWVSPVNYKGYKISRNKIILFGIEEPDMMKLYRIEGQLIMKSGNEFFKLILSDDFSSYHAVSQSEFPVSMQ